MGRIVGIIAIKNYLGWSESTVMDAIHHQGMPAVKKSNVWEVDQAALDRWKTPPLASEVGQRVEPPKKADAKKEEKPKARSRKSRKRSK
jgi:hypothetical protein